LSKFTPARFCIVCLLASMFTTLTHAAGFSMGPGKSYSKSYSYSYSYSNDGYTTNRPWGNVEPSKPAPQYQPPQPMPGSYYIGAAPGTGWYTAQLPAGSTAGNTAPVIEVEVEGSVFYEQQNIIYTVHVVSDGNLASLDPELPRIEGAVLEQIDGPVASTRSSGYNRAPRIVNTFRYKLMPIRAGKVVVPAIRFTGTHASGAQASRGQDNKFSISAAAPLTLQVRQADPSVQPWLPLHDLRLQTNLQQDGPAKAGQPVILTLELTARGALGTQLPSLAHQLDSPQYRVYRDSTTTQNGISSNGRYLTGSRKETYTLIPLEDGVIHLPEVNVAWWDIDMQTARIAGLPSTQAGAGNAAGLASTGTGQPLFPVYFWAPMAIALALIAGFWLGAWHRTRPLFKLAGTWLSATAQRAVQRSQRLGSKFSPVRHVQRLRMGFALLMPKSVRIWMCTRCLVNEENPHAWCNEFKSRVCEHLDMSSHSSLTSIAEKLIATNPRAEPARLRELAHSLDGALYGDRPLDFLAWKRELRHQLRPHLLRRSRARSRYTGNQLPALNPTSA
jgi:hypothetical protein